MLCPVCNKDFTPNSVILKRCIKSNKQPCCSRACGIKYSYILNGENVKQQRKNTMVSRYGVEHAAQSKDIQNKTKSTNLKNLGVEYPTQSKIVIEKRKINTLNAYGVEHTLQRNDVINKRLNTVFNKCCEDNPNFKILRSRESFIEYIISNFTNRKPLIIEIAALSKINYSTINLYVNKLQVRDYICDHVNSSLCEKEILDYIKSILPLGTDIIENTKTVISPYELDIYIPSKNIAFEYNGNYWHSEINKNKEYHQIKSILCEKKHIRLIHIFEHEWVEKKSLIKSLINESLNIDTNKIYARKCEIKEIDNKTYSDFCIKNHLQGYAPAKIKLGLFYQNELVQLMSFSTPRYKQGVKYEWEIIRGCPGSLSRVIGGVGKLFKHFVRHYKPKSVMSYCDFAKFNGISYEKIGMKYEKLTVPGFKWYIPEVGVFNRDPYKRKQYMDQGGVRIYDSGSKVFAVYFDKES